MQGADLKAAYYPHLQFKAGPDGFLYPFCCVVVGQGKSLQSVPRSFSDQLGWSSRTV